MRAVNSSLRNAGSESDADEDRFVDELDAEGRAYPVPHLSGQGQQVGGAPAVGVDEREGVLAGDPRQAEGMALGEARVLDEPGGGGLGTAARVGVAREARPGPAFELGEALGVQDRVGEERSGAAGVGVSRVEHHALAPAQFQYSLAGGAQRYPLARLYPERAGQFGVADGLGLLGVAQREGDLKDHVPVRGDLEDAVAGGEPAPRSAHGDRPAAPPVLRPY